MATDAGSWGTAAQTIIDGWEALQACDRAARNQVHAAGAELYDLSVSAAQTMPVLVTDLQRCLDQLAALDLLEA